MPGSNNDNNVISGPALDSREEKLLKRKEKLDKKKKVRRTDFTPDSDIDIFPEDDE